MYNTEFNDTQDQDTEELDSVEEKDENVEQSTEDKQEETPVDDEKDKQTFLSKMKDKLFGKKEEKDEDKGSTDTEEDIDDSFVEAARAQGWKDEEIVKFSKNYTNTELKQLIPYLTDEETEKDDSEEVKTEEKKEDKKEEKDLNSLEEKITKALEAKYQEKINQLEKRLGEIDKDRSTKETQQYQTTADKFFDSASKDFPVFGKTEELPRFPTGTKNAGQVVPTGEAYKARSEVWQTAKAFFSMGLDWDSSLKEALDWYKGKTLEKDTRSKVLKELKRNEKRLSPKRTEHTGTKKFNSPEEEKRATIDNIARQAGLDI